MKAEPLTPDSKLSDAATDRPRKILLPSGYTLYAFPVIVPDYDGSHDIRISIYPPGSDCQDKDDRVGELLMWSMDADEFLNTYR